MSLHLKLPASQYDELFQRAQRERVSVPEQARREMERGKEPNKT